MDKTSGANKGKGSSCRAGKKVEVIEVEDEDKGTEFIMSALRLMGQELRGLREKIAG